MSRIFGALRRSESERSGTEYEAVSSVASELVQAAERAERKEAQYLGAPCHSCGSSVPAGRLFCPKCDSFQGSLASQQCEERDSSAEHQSSSDPPVSGFRCWSLEKWVHAPSRIAIALVASLIPLMILVLIFYRGSSVTQNSHPQQIELASASNAANETMATTHNKTEIAPSFVQTKRLTWITGLQQRSLPESSTVIIDLQDRVQWQVHRLMNPYRIYFDLHDTVPVAGLSHKAIEIGDALVVRARVARHTKRVTRVVLETTGPSSYSVSLEQNPYRLVVEVHKPSAKRRPHTTSSHLLPPRRVRTNGISTIHPHGTTQA
jgi:AMIN domain